MAILNQYHRPATVEEAVALLEANKGRFAALAGGAQLIGQLQIRQRPELEGVVDLAALPLREIVVEDECVRLGAMVTLAAVVEHKIVGAIAGGILKRTARAEGPVNLRNVATIGAVVALAEYDSEFYAALLALDATIAVRDLHGITMVPLGEFVLQPGTLITEVLVGCSYGQGGHARLARTPSDRPIVAAVVASMPGATRVALCGVAGRPVLLGAPLTPPEDFKGSADYRAAMAEIVAQRAMAEIVR